MDHSVAFVDRLRDRDLILRCVNSAIRLRTRIEDWFTRPKNERNERSKKGLALNHHRRRIDGNLQLKFSCKFSTGMVTWI